MLLLKEVGGALVLGLSAGFATYYMLKRVDNYQVEVLLTLALGIYALTDAMHLSAPIAVVVAGLFVGNQGRALAMTEKTREHVDTFWELIDEILNAVLFLLIGLEILILPLEHQWLIAGSLAIPIVLFARWLSVAGIIGSLKWVSDQSKGDRADLGRIARRDFRGDGVITACQRFQKPLTDADVLCRRVFNTCSGTYDWATHPTDNSSVVSRDPKCAMKGRISFNERKVSHFAAASASSHRCVGRVSD